MFMYRLLNIEKFLKAKAKNKENVERNKCCCRRNRLTRNREDRFDDDDEEPFKCRCRPSSGMLNPCFCCYSDNWCPLRTYLLVIATVRIVSSNFREFANPGRFNFHDMNLRPSISSFTSGTPFGSRQCCYSTTWRAMWTKETLLLLLISSVSFIRSTVTNFNSKLQFPSNPVWILSLVAVIDSGILHSRNLSLHSLILRYIASEPKVQQTRER